MHKLDRESVAEPICLKSYDYRTHNWDAFTGTCKRQVRLALLRMQGIEVLTEDADEEAHYIYGLRCAYCESTIYSGGHIEHFRRKNKAHYPELTFEWTNLFLACVSTAHCGHYKDRRSADPYNPNDLIKPDEHEPENFFYIHSTGEIRCREGISEVDKHRSYETVRVFNLNESALCGSRFRALKLYRSRTPNLLEDLMEYEQEDRDEYIKMEIEATKLEPYSTIIRHYLEKVS